MVKYTLYVANETNNLEHSLAKRFGGLTATRGRGLWSDGEKWYDEGVNVLVVFSDGSEDIGPQVFDSFVADFTNERAYVLESKGEGEIRFVEELRSTWRTSPIEPDEPDDGSRNVDPWTGEFK